MEKSNQKLLNQNNSENNDSSNNHNNLERLNKSENDLPDFRKIACKSNLDNEDNIEKEKNNEEEVKIKIIGERKNRAEKKALKNKFIDENPREVENPSTNKKKLENENEKEKEENKDIGKEADKDIDKNSSKNAKTKKNDLEQTKNKLSILENHTEYYLVYLFNKFICCNDYNKRMMNKVEKILSFDYYIQNSFIQQQNLSTEEKM